jgi:hypothetical protein
VVIGEKLFGVETSENHAKNLVKQLYSISIDYSIAKQIMNIAQQKYPVRSASPSATLPVRQDADRVLAGDWP